jgi:hypothetical protein
MPAQYGWTGCHKCLTLFFSGWPWPKTAEGIPAPQPNGSCHAAAPLHPLTRTKGPHEPDFNWRFAMETNPSARGDSHIVLGWTDGFFRCKRCEAMYNPAAGTLCSYSDAPAPDVDVLPGGLRGRNQYQHQIDNATVFYFPTEWGPYEHFQHGWKVCGKCGVLFYAKETEYNGVCRGGGSHHAISYDFGVQFWL